MLFQDLLVFLTCSCFFYSLRFLHTDAPKGAENEVVMMEEDEVLGFPESDGQMGTEQPPDETEEPAVAGGFIGQNLQTQEEPFGDQVDVSLDNEYDEDEFEGFTPKVVPKKPTPGQPQQPSILTLTFCGYSLSEAT